MAQSKGPTTEKPLSPDRCLACGSRVVEREPQRVVCTKQCCVFTDYGDSDSGLDVTDYLIMASLLDDRYNAGYQAALKDTVASLDKLENSNEKRD